MANKDSGEVVVAKLSIEAACVALQACSKAAQELLGPLERLSDFDKPA